MQWSYVDSALLVVVSVYLFKAPFTKVEESFTIQAIHDILNYGIFGLESYDHFQFPGAVPRSFVGPLIIAALTKICTVISSCLPGNSSEPTQLGIQTLARAMIGLTNAFSLIYVKNSAQRLFDLAAKKREDDEARRREQSKSVSIREPDANLSTVGTWFLVFVMTGFHLMYYASRPLPNFVLTLPLINVATAWVLQSRYQWSILLFALTSAVFRSEVAAMGSGIGLLSVVYGKISLLKAIKFGFMGLVLGMGVSLTVDSYFWQVWCIPEVDAFIFNVLKGNATNWGTEPFFAYFTHYLRMLFVPPTILLLNLLGFRMAPTELKIVSLSALFHILIMSLQPHKEWRFIVYALPPIILLGSTAAAYVWENIDINSVRNMLFVCLLPLSPLLSLAISSAFLYVSSLNYPGGEAVAKFNDMIVASNITNSTVHLSVPVCMTGATLFGELDHSVYGIRYDRSEKVSELEELWPSFDYLITTEPHPSLIPFSESPAERWEMIQSTTMFSGVNSTFISNIWSEDKNLIGVLKDSLDMPTSIVSQLSQLLDNVVMREPIFFTYKRIKAEPEQ
ncbi:hypothetical protein HG536_0A09110 [Torulaspora globosa]|uniref:Mannosyltransferase n=1 Tax=Torulaspora globosa TaxID=48254 RepID=A0A7G3ZC58_9SACH|nr:uncharacterized protein HG536_0A09110 [Torulaspora globosa]QLL31094.1 hypothetical protein HG536_0A09110 [Torulaspora globosa]